MLGLMQDRPLLISQIIDYAAAYYPDVEIVSRTAPSIAIPTARRTGARGAWRRRWRRLACA